MLTQAIRHSYGAVTALVIVDGGWLAIAAGDVAYYRGNLSRPGEGGGLLLFF